MGKSQQEEVLRSAGHMIVRSRRQKQMYVCLLSHKLSEVGAGNWTWIFLEAWRWNLRQSEKQKGLDPLRKAGSCSWVPSVPSRLQLLQSGVQGWILGLQPIIKKRESWGVRAAGSLGNVLPRSLPSQQQEWRVRMWGWVLVVGGQQEAPPMSRWELFAYVLTL